jgi:hypothetical protein
MKKQIVFFLFSFLAMKFATQAQSNFDINKDEQSGQTMFVGKCLFDDISEEASFDWFTMSSNNYNPDPTITEQLKKVLYLVMNIL